MNSYSYVETDGMERVSDLDSGYDWDPSGGAVRAAAGTERASSGVVCDQLRLDGRTDAAHLQPAGNRTRAVAQGGDVADSADTHPRSHFLRVFSERLS